MNDSFVTQIETEAKNQERKRAMLEKIGKGIRGDELMKKIFPPLRWIVEGVLPQGELCVLSGKKGSGKTLLALNLVQTVSSGIDFLGLKTNTTKMLFISLEMGSRTIQTRLGESRLPWNPENVQFFWNWPRLPEGAKALENFIDSHKIGLTFIDVVAKIRALGADWSAYGAAYEQFGPLREIAQRTDSCIALLTHERKGEAGEDPTERILGSIGLSGNAGVLLSLRRMIHENRGTLEISGNDIQHQKIPVELKTDPLLFVRSDVSYTELEQTPERRAIMEIVRSFGRPVTTHQVAEKYGKGDSTVSEILRKLVQAGLLVSVGYGKYSILTPESTETTESGQATKEHTFGTSGTFGMDATVSTEQLEIF